MEPHQFPPLTLLSHTSHYYSLDPPIFSQFLYLRTCKSKANTTFSNFLSFSFIHAKLTTTSTCWLSSQISLLIPHKKSQVISLACNSRITPFLIQEKIGFIIQPSSFCHRGTLFVVFPHSIANPSVLRQTASSWSFLDSSLLTWYKSR
jgi:hypothetical protein